MNGSWKRPKLHIPKTTSERISDIIGYGVWSASIALLIFVWNDLPDQVPAHYNFAGEVDRWGAKYELLILPAISLLLAVMMQIFEKYPETHNYPSRLNEDNAEAFYRLSRKLCNQVKNICLFLFAITQYESIAIALGWSMQGIGPWFFLLFIGGTMIPVAIALVKQRKIQ
ncbi:DUF1648 domain-containing protein [Bacillaceae bacterium SIJ1]|uniref:DUF1648 domain-containing protein n=1 Tax=Litoribacterium kuwaitense TaxID=1398745 RepID=UPI0013EB67E8|nr:DUF1648 domain-containing protein [Litoribacterium kuwaitense]NGP45281.1 DUF1648 domain-containing protein [Litoribacterium kuwaitense]